MEQKKTVLIVEDEKNIVDILRFNLQREGYATLEAYDGEAGLTLAREKKPDILLLDVMMPKMMGFDVCRALREEGDNVPVIILTAREEEEDKILGLEIGADDYITKPYSVRNVIARVKTVLRRTSGQKVAERNNTLSVDGLSLDLDLKTCSVDGEEVKLTKKEFELLAFLIANKGKICSRDQILANVWSDEVIVLDRTIDVNITRIRQKIGEYGSCIITRAGFGYGFRN